MLRCIASLWIQPYDVEDVLELIAFPQLKRLHNTVQKHRCPAVFFSNMAHDNHLNSKFACGCL